MKFQVLRSFLHKDRAIHKRITYPQHSTYEIYVPFSSDSDKAYEIAKTIYEKVKGTKLEEDTSLQHYVVTCAYNSIFSKKYVSTLIQSEFKNVTDCLYVRCISRKQ